VDSLEQTALLHTVDRVLRGRGQDPKTISIGDKFSIATQCVQLCALHEHTLYQAARRLSEALGANPRLPLEELVLDAVSVIGERGAG
jgi:hypothetical protein